MNDEGSQVTNARSTLTMTSGVPRVGTGGHVPTYTSAGVGREICTNSKSFWRNRGEGVADSAWAWRYTVCPLQIVYAYLASGGFATRPPPGFYPWTPLGLPFPRPPESCAHPTSKPWLRHWQWQLGSPRCQHDTAVSLCDSERL